MMFSSESASFLRLAAVVLYLSLIGALLAHVSMNLNPRFLNLPDSVGSQQAIRDRTPATFSGRTDDIGNWRNRVLLPYAIDGFAHLTGSSYGRAYIVARWATATLALAAQLLLLRRALGLALMPALGGVTFFAVTLVPTFLHIYEIPSDFLDAGFFSVLTVLALARARVGFALVLAVALLNRESAIFAVVVWFALHCARGRAFWIEATLCVAVGVAGTALVTWLRVFNASHAGATGVQTYEPAMFWQVNARVLREWLHAPHFGHPYFFLAGFFTLLALVVLPVWTGLPGFIRRLALASAAIFALSAVSNNLNELRIFIPSLILANVLILAALRSGFEPRSAVTA
jgi:hypothetical protein